MNLDISLTRRELVENALRAAVLPGGAAFFSRWLKADDPLTDYQPKFFPLDDFAALQSVTEILIPTDDTPGAREAKCAHFIDFVLHSSDEVPKTQENWRKAMQALKDAGFHAADPARRLDIVSEMDQSAHHPAFFAYRLIKQQTAFAFYTSREGTIQTLDYKGNSYNVTFPACTHPEHQVV
jgi:hypothetical protein